MRVLYLLALLLLPLPTLAQGPSADWRTIRTPHFRVHYPAPSEAWTQRAAARLESIRERVAAEVGYAPPEVVDVLVSDPVADPNGMAVPILGWPRMVLWTSPPGPESVLGHYRDWSEILIVHEETHLVHLLRPSRNPVRRLLATLAPVGPIALGAPRWVTEGYATVVEGRLTGAGRPNSDLRAAILRRWAQAGKLPTYGRLASDRQGWRGMSMAYLAGSAYLEWLEEKAGPGSLRNLWARMTARSGRDFDSAFEGVFGDSPQDLYDRFRAELTWRALEAERRSAEAGPAIEGELWQDLSWTTGAPALSPEGEKLVIELSARELPSRLVVWSTAPNEKAEKEWEERRQKLLERDPEDVPAVRNRPLPREPLHTLGARDGVEPTTPRWTAGGRSVLFVRFEPDGEGFLHPDLFLWEPESDEVRRLTREADVRDPDPSPVAADPDWAVGVRNRHGLSQIVHVDLRTGEVRGITEPSVEEVYDRPRISPDGRRIAFARHREGAWRLVIRDLGSGEEAVLAPPAGGTVSAPAWSPDGRTVYAVVGDRGFIDVWAFPADGGSAPVRLTRTQGAALSPAPAPDGKALFFLSLESDGLDLRRLELTPEILAGSGPPADLPEILAPAIRPATPEPPEPFALAEVPAGRRYGLGRQEILPLIGGSDASSGGFWELGVRGGDILGRLDYLALGALSDQGWLEGGALAVAWRGWPVEVGFHLFRSEERPSEQRGTLSPRSQRGLDLERQGLELSAGWERLWSGGRLRLDGRLLREEVDPALGEDLSRTGGSLAGGFGGLRQWGQWRLTYGLTARREEGRTEGDDWSRSSGAARLGLRRKDTGLSLSWRRDGSGGTFHPSELLQLGGTETSLLPRSATFSLIPVPALPFGTLVGTEHEGQRAELSLDFLPAPLFFERHRVWTDGSLKGDWLSLAGLEWRWSTGPLPIGRVPALDVRLGAAQILEEPFPEKLFEDDIRWWLIAVWRP
ncbi:MAG TPA: hypothetical protein VF756_06360 [Thermoanaerobaculia bacterium]